tara:strand:+ start:5207 stop:5665 length:459 start_codon:yes stop_codon:yes gene_type:complete
MGTYYSTYIGCFIKIPRINIPVTKSYYQTVSGKRSNTRFNPETGEEYEKVTIVVNETRTISAYIKDSDDLDEDMFSLCQHSSINDSYSILIPNRESDICKMNTEWDYSCSLLHINPENEILKFKRQYSKYLDYFTEKYGEYEIDFGVVRNGN